MVRTIDIDALVEDEWYMVRHSGEIPEVAFHSALFHLVEDHHGPQVTLTEEQRGRLLEAVALRYLEITLRDLMPENKNTSGYRGLRRSLINWQRFLRFCQRYDIEATRYQNSVASALEAFVSHELGLFENEGSGDQFNCSFAELERFMGLLGVDPAVLPTWAKDHCLGA